MRDFLVILLPNILLWLVFITALLARFQGSRLQGPRRFGRIRLHEFALILFFVSTLPIGPRLATQLWTPPNVAIDAVTVPPGSNSAVVVFGGGLRALAGTASWPTEASLRRGVVGSAVARKIAAPLFISGAETFNDGPTEAGLLAQFLAHPGVVVLDETATNTWENAQAIKAAMAQHGWTHIIAVTDDTHARRARACLSAVGIQPHAVVTPAPPPRYSWGDLIPRVKSLTNWRNIGYEFAATVSYMATGRIGLSDLF